MTARVLPPVPEDSTGLQSWIHSEVHGHTADTLSRQRSCITQPPPGFPGFIDDGKNWSGSDSTDTQKYVLSLAGTEKQAEIREGFQVFDGLELDGDEVTRERFPLRGIRDVLEKATTRVHHGSGVCILRGLKWDDYTVEDSIVLFLALSSYVGDQRGLQNSKGDMLSHVTESKAWTVPKEKRHGIHTNDSLPFHNDMGCEILSIQVRDQADAGGHTCVASMTSIYNDLLQSGPWVLHVLAEHNWPVQTSLKKDPPFILCPLLEFHAGNLLISMDPARIGPHPLSRNDSIPCLTADQQEALAVLQRTAEKHQLRLETQPGDIVLINNLGLLHARESYQDGVSSSRHLVRLWLRNTELGWPIPPSMKMPWDAAFGDRAAKLVNRHYPIVPMPEYMECKYSNGTAAFVADDSDDEASLKAGKGG